MRREAATARTTAQWLENECLAREGLDTKDGDLLVERTVRSKGWGEVRRFRIGHACGQAVSEGDGRRRSAQVSHNGQLELGEIACLS